MNHSSPDLTSSIFEEYWFRKPNPEYLQELLQDKKKLQCFQLNFNFRHLLNILEKEISCVREKLFHINRTNIQIKSIEKSLPCPKGEYVTLQEKIYVPVEENPNYNFIGRILGPRGLTAKQLEQELQCKLMIRGKGSLRTKEKEDDLKGKPNWEHLNDKLHINITVEDYENRAKIKLDWALKAIKKFIEQGIKMPVGEDDIKKRQLMELAIINGTYRDTSKKSQNSSYKSESKINSITVDKRSIHNFPYSNGSILLDYVSLNNILPQNSLDSSLFNIFLSLNSSTLTNNHNKSFNTMMPIINQGLTNILSTYRSSSVESILPINSVTELYHFQNENIGTNNLLGPIRIRNVSTEMKPHPYQMMGNI